jgi:hypothetical protein
MEKQEFVGPIKPISPEGEVVNSIAAYLQKHGKFNAFKIANMVYEAVGNNSATEIRDVEAEILSQVIENMRTHAIWEKWGE